MKRDSIESEACGLKIAQLLLPRDDDRLFAQTKDAYNQHAISITENTSASLGLVSSFGFILLIGHIFFRKKNTDPILDALTHLNLSAILLATMGGFSSLIAFFFLASIRAYNRISVFIAFFALAAIFVFLQKRAKTHPVLWCTLLTAIGLYTQSSPIDAPHIKYPQIAFEYENDRAFVQKIEQTLPPGSMVFQLPFIHFPEGARHLINSYAHFKCPLHSCTLKWSFGAMRRRDVSRWQKRTSRLDLPDMLKEITQKGFTGLYIDKFGYADAGGEIHNRLSQLLKTDPIYDKHGRSFWDLRDYAH